MGYKKKDNNYHFNIMTKVNSSIQKEGGKLPNITSPALIEICEVRDKYPDD